MYGIVKWIWLSGGVSKGRDVMDRATQSSMPGSSESDGRSEITNSIDCPDSLDCHDKFRLT